MEDTTKVTATDKQSIQTECIPDGKQKVKDKLEVVPIIEQKQTVQYNGKMYEIANPITKE